MTLNAVLLKAGANPVVVAKMADGHSLLRDCRIFAHSLHLFTGVTGIEDLLAVLTAFLEPGGVALDVGANVGTVTVPLAQAAQRVGARVIAFEPFPNNVEWLHQNLQLNNLEQLVTVVESGLSSVSGEATLLLREDFESGATVGNSSVAEPGNAEHFRRVTIQLNTLDALWPTYGSPRLDIIKIDIEGHEDRFLEGARETLIPNRPVILMEVNRSFYRKRGVDFDTLIPQLLPPDCRYFTSPRTEVPSLASVTAGDVLLIPSEKVHRLVS